MVPKILVSCTLGITLEVRISWIASFPDGIAISSVKAKSFSAYDVIKCSSSFRAIWAIPRAGSDTIWLLKSAVHRRSPCSCTVSRTRVKILRGFRLLVSMVWMAALTNRDWQDSNSGLDKDVLKGSTNSRLRMPVSSSGVKRTVTLTEPVTIALSPWISLLRKNTFPSESMILAISGQ